MEPRYFSYSRVSTDEHCERARYYASEFGGTGIQSTSSGWDLVFGNILHKYLNDLATNGRTNYNAARVEVQEAALKAGLGTILARDYSVVAEGQLRGFVRWIWPQWMDQFEIVETERLRHWEAQVGFIFRYKQDILLRSRTTGLLVYPDYKTTSSDDPKWIAAWNKSAQLHSSMYAMLHGYNIDIDHSLAVGLYKGYKDRKDKDVPRSIFSYGWVNREYSMMPKYAYEYQRGRGWERFSTAEEFENLESWIANMPEAVLSQQFPTSAPIHLRTDIAATYFRQQLLREQEIMEAINALHQSTDIKEIEYLLDKHFRQDFSKCQPAYGFGCEFANICWIPSVAEDPIASGQYVRRIPVTEEIPE